MRALIATVAALLAGSAPAGAEPLWQPWTPPAAEYGAVVRQTDVPIRMSDGIVLRADVLRPAGPGGQAAPGPFPVLLTQTPYNKRVGAAATEFMVRHGYVQVIADVRGTGSSQGVWDGLGTREQRDGYELVEWAAAQPWSDGRVGTRGVSYMAANQFFTAAQKPPALKALFTIVPMADAYRDLFLQGGQINTEFVSLWFALITGTSMVPASYTTSEPNEGVRTLVNHGGGAVGYQGGQTASAAAGGDVAYDGPQYRSRSPIEVIDEVDLPVFITGGWFDLFQRGEPLLFEALQKQGNPVHLLMGPWYHNNPGAGLPSTEAGIPNLGEIELRWFEHHLKGRPDPALDDGSAIPPISYYEIGSERWRADREWNGDDIDFRALHLGGPASIGVPGTLSPDRPEPSAADTLPWNPATGTCTRSTAQWTTGLLRARGLCEDDQRANDAAGLTYRMPVTEPLELVGPISARLFVSSLNGRDGQITARVEDIGPDGSSRQMTAGWQVLSLRALDLDRTAFSDDGLITRPFHPFTRESEQQMPADGSPVEVVVEIFPTGWRLEPGHELQLSLQTSDAPHLTSSAPQATGSAGGVLSIHHDAEHDSQLVIPVKNG